MIEIPYNVKRALRLGRYKKNYKFLVRKTAEGYIPFTFSNDSSSDHHSFTAPYEGTYDIDGDIDGVYFSTLIEPNPPTYAPLTRTVYLEEGEEMYLWDYDPSVSPISIIYYGEYEITFTIDNDNLVKESVLIDERMSSGSELKFGLCEGSSLEFQYFGYPNIRGAEIQAFISVQYKNDLGAMAWYDIPMGWFTVDECPMQFSTGIYKVTAYNKLMSKYLDAKANNLIKSISEDNAEDGKVSVNAILSALLNDYTIEEKIIGIPMSPVSHSSSYSKTVSVIGKSDNYSLSISSVDSSAEFTQFYQKTIAVEDIKKYCDYVSDAMEKLKEWIVSKVVNGETIWNNEFSKVCLISCFPICFVTTYPDVKEVHYIPQKYYTSNTITLNNVTYNVRPLDELYRLTNLMPSQVPIEKYCLWLEVYTNAGLRNLSTSTWEFEWTYDKKDDFNDCLPKLYDVTDSQNIMGQIAISKTDLPDVTLRELQSAVYETVAQFGQLDRVTDLFSGVELNTGGEYPAETLYPAADLYPGGHALHPFPSEYQKLWTDTVGEQTFRYLIITYKTTEIVSGQTQEVEKTLQRTVHEHGTTNYNMSDNWLFRNLIWTAEQVGAYADAMVLKMQGLKWFPFEMWATGLPYVETGDAIEITDKDGDTHYSYILQRQLKGIHALQDTFINGELDVF